MVQKINPTSNYYELLGVSVKATTAEIKDAYRRLALELHPDVNADPDDHERFRLVADAYRVLLDPQMRKKYDTMRLLSFGWPITRLRDTVANPVAFNQLMNKVGTMLAVASGIVRKPVGEPGRDMTLGTTLSFWESFQGVERRFEYKREIDCADCKGSGFAKVAVCEICHGAGRLRSDFMPMVGKRCPRCAAKGWIGVENCATCSGTGRVEDYHGVMVKIPAGVQHAGRVRLSKQGEGGRHGGKDGDLVINVTVLLDGLATRQGNDLIMPVDVDIRTAALGGVAAAEFPHGRLKFRVPEASWNHRRLRVPGRGFRDPKTGQTGDFFAVLSIAIPDALPSDDRELARQYLHAVKGPEDAPAGLFRDELVKRFAT